MNEYDPNYLRQVQLLIQLLDVVKHEQCFALKGGTAINLFIRDLPRMSIDIDLTYLPFTSREIALQEIEDSLLRMKTIIEKQRKGISVFEKRAKSNQRLQKIMVGDFEKIKIEPNEILRGALCPVETHSLCERAAELFGVAVDNVPLLSREEIYAGKICAALDRQHPRDLFDIKILYENEGITNEIQSAFVVYLASSPRPINELLNPNLLDQRLLYEAELEGMTNMETNYNELVGVREQLINDISQNLTSKERQFLLSVKLGEPEWSLLPFEHLHQLPALKWKVMNVNKMDKKKHKLMLDRLKATLQM